MGRDKKGKRATNTSAVTFEAARKLALALPETEEGTSYGTPAFRVGKEPGTSAVALGRCVAGRQDVFPTMLDADESRPRGGFSSITDHYLNYPWVLVRLANCLTPTIFARFSKQAWRLVAPGASVPRLYKASQRSPCVTDSEIQVHCFGHDPDLRTSVRLP